MATYQSEVENLTLEVLGSWDRPLNKRNEVRPAAAAAALLPLLALLLLALLLGLENGCRQEPALWVCGQTQQPRWF